ncbi:2-succinylbenzoate--CoA ligase [Bhargavaea cecembensis DSE10]|uniref:2-succinylbenzoate--CoA ligase n=1 Tax=Bhargavaea cecembensis DSE10 TaxID=1235279 RepID=M7NAN9_9BACL|nr:o-succinylbenzoate--CoA ligase [Bhargavaea cecembensis]EMR05658.1 2-succinylbenzoate--CoA ligase [Bhargavaea cecembensis DSE10]
MKTPNWILQRAGQTPDRIAISWEDKQWTFREVAERAMDIARKMRGTGLQEGDRVALLTAGGPDTVFLIHGGLLAGFELVMLNSRLTQDELAYQIEDSGAKAVFADDALLERVPDSTAVSHLLSGEGMDFEPVKLWEEDRTLTIMYTSGTTGFPKGVRQTAGNHLSSAVASALNMGLQEGDVWLCAMPLFHISGFSILCRSLIYGMTVRLQTKFDAEASAREIAEGSVTTMSAVSAQLVRVLDILEARNERASGRFRQILAGGGPVPSPYIRRAEALGIRILQTYGMTETSSQTATLAAEDALRKTGSSGKPLFFNRIRIDGAEKPGDEGEILISGPHVTPGYVGRFSDKPAQVDGWLHTGDIGRLDEEGFLFVLDRRSDLIISGGENIYPAEIEQVLVGHPAVAEAGVAGVEDERWGQVPAAFIVGREDVTAEELETFCRERLARYKVPKHFRFVAELPRNASNKLLRRELRTKFDLQE